MAQLHALVVDDSPAMRKQLSYALQRVMGMDATEAGDGADAWRKLATASYDILITDINMPLMDGLKLVALVRAGGPHLSAKVRALLVREIRSQRSVDDLGISLRILDQDRHQRRRAIRLLIPRRDEYTLLRELDATDRLVIDEAQVVSAGDSAP